MLRTGKKKGKDVLQQKKKGGGEVHVARQELGRENEWEDGL